MNYHNILHDDMSNGDGLRVVLFVSGCEHRCSNCQNSQTWDCNSGIPFDYKAKDEIFEQLDKDYISGITFSGGDPLNENNLYDVFNLVVEVFEKYPNKNIWLYSGYKWEEIFPIVDTDDLKSSDFYTRQNIIELCDVLVDGKFEQDLADIKYHWAGSTNQRVIDVQKSLNQNKIILKGEN